MTVPISVDLPHRLGKAEARRRIESGMGGLTRHLPAGAQVQPHWTGDQLHLAVSALGQDLRTRIDVQETVVRVEVVLPPALGFLAGMIEAGVRRGGAELLEDRSKS
jgi:putative polyhydroxyalkanoate system protein